MNTKTNTHQERRKAGKRSGTGGHLQKICSAVILPVFLCSLFAFAGCTSTGSLDTSNPSVTAVETVAANAVVSIANAEVDSLVASIGKTRAALAPVTIKKSEQTAEAKALRANPQLPRAEVHRLILATYHDRLSSP